MSTSLWDEIPFLKQKTELVEGMRVPMCWCGDRCRFMKSLVLGDYYGMRFFMCRNYAHDPPKMRLGSNRPKSPPPLCDFMQWFDTEQSKEGKEYIERVARSAKEKWERMKREEKQEKLKEEKHKKDQEDVRRRMEEADREEAEEREAEREKKRERARRAKEAGPEAIRKGKYPRCTQWGPDE